MSVNQEFLNELEALLDKYQGAINYEEDGEGYSVHNRRMTVTVPKKNGRNRWDEQVILTVPETYLSASHIPTSS